tara:strand:+ start:257 stop:394 length:138 start_codon:yes stop_codon:yes gene_type:complete
VEQEEVITVLLVELDLAAEVEVPVLLEDLQDPTHKVPEVLELVLQ